MFEFVRTKLKDSIFSKIFLTLLAMSFGIWGVGDFIGAGGLDPTIAVKVGKTSIQTDEFQRRYTQELERLKKTVGPEVVEEPAMKQSVLNSLIEDITRTATISAVAHAMNVVVPQENLRQAVLEEKAFQDPTGHFSESQFVNVLEQNNLTERGFLAIFEDNLRQALMLKPVLANTSAPKTLSDALFRYRTEGRVADTLLVKASTLPAPKTPSEDDLKALYTKNLGTFTAPEYRKVTAVVLRADDLAKPDAVDEAELKTYYDQNSGRYKTPATRHIVQLIFDSKEKADAARAMAAPGDSLEQLAVKAKAGSVIDIGDMTADSPLAKTIAAAFVLPPHEISQPIQTELGWHLFEVTALTPETVQALDTVKDKVRDAVAQEKAVDAMYDASVQLEDQVAAGTALPEVAKNVNAKLLSLEFDRDGKDPKGADAGDIPERASLIKIAFTTASGADSGLKELADRKGYYVLKVDGITPPKPKPFENVRSEVVAMYDKQSRQDEAQATAERLVAQVKAATSLQTFETPDKRVTLATVGPVSRFGEALQRGTAVPNDRISPEVLERLFNAKVGDVFIAPVVDGVLVAKVREIRSDAPGDAAQGQAQVQAALQQSISTDLLEQLTHGLSTRYPVEVNNKVVNDMVAQAR